MKYDGSGNVTSLGSSAAEIKSTRMASVLVVDDTSDVRDSIYKGLSRHFGLVEVASDIESADALWQRVQFGVIITDVNVSGKSGIGWVRELREQGCMTPVIFMTDQDDMRPAIEALRVGATDYLIKPVNTEMLLGSVKKSIQSTMHSDNARQDPKDSIHCESSDMVGDSEKIRRVCQIVKQIAQVQSTVLIEGESGTGKELAAQAIHKFSGRSGSFVPLNCAAMSTELLESELFGHTKGAFTSAHQSRDGLFVHANGGTLFLDEIGEMPLSMQSHLLRVLEEKVIRKVGSNQGIPVDVRVIAASNRDLADEVKKGNFRQDLYYRLNVLSIRMPTLRERLDDLPKLAQHFSSTLAYDMGLPVPAYSDAEICLLQTYEWPGNVRELKNVIERSLLLNMTPSQCISGLCRNENLLSVIETDSNKSILLEEVEKRHILKVLEMQKGNKSAAARCLGVSRKTLERKVQAWQNIS